MKRRALTLATALACGATAADAAEYHLTISEKPVTITGRPAKGLTINGSIPGPTLRWKEGEEVTVKVTNSLAVDTSIHWHGLILPYRMDGVPKISFGGIKPGETFTYRFTVHQAGTYWYHSHSGVQEQSGVYGSIVIEPRKRVHRYDRDVVIVLSDWSDTKAMRILANLKRESDYYNMNKRTLVGLLRDLRDKRKSPRGVIADRMDWGRMRMDPTDIADVTGSTYTYLVNGKSPNANWTALFRPGERVRVRFINGSAMTYFDVKIPGLDMTVVQADGQDVRPVKVREFRIAVAETYDVIVTPKGRNAYTIFARSMDRSGFARATLATRPGLSSPVPPLGRRPVLTMEAMGHGGHGGHGGATGGASSASGPDHGKMDHSKMGHTVPAPSVKSKTDAVDHSKMDHSRMGHGTPPAAAPRPAMPLRKAGAETHPMLKYEHLKAFRPNSDERPHGREIVLRLTGSMERYFWTINGRKYSDAKPIRLRLGERVRFTFVNETMMDHPMHLHGMWMNLVNGAGARLSPKKHTVSVPPGKRVSADITVDAPGEWAFHCHLLFHMETGMFRKIVVARSQVDAN